LGKELDIESVFDKPSASEWIDKINKDLKGAKTADDLQYIVENSLTISAIQTYTSVEYAPIARDREYSIARHIDTSDSDCNKEIKDLLNIGVNTLILDSYADVDYSRILDGVILDYIQLVIYPMDDQAEMKAIEYLQGVSADMNKVYASSLDRNLIHVPYSDSISEQLADLLQKVSNTDSKELLLIMDGQKDFLSEISKIRAAHILLANLNKATQRNINYNLLSHTKPNSEGVHELIQSSYMGLAAIIGEADGIVSVTLDPKYKLNAVHTFNLFTMESYLGKVSDPSAGSNLIEEMTKVLCQESWGKFVKVV